MNTTQARSGGHPDTFTAQLESLDDYFPKPLDRDFDIFLSYRSEDDDWMRKLKRALSARGVKVWADKDQIRPGDRFAQALEEGIGSSRALCLLVTPESVESNWVKDEYYRALSLANDGKLQLIPAIVRHATLPPFLANRQYVDFSSPANFENAVDKLVWPGITGQRIKFYTMPYYEFKWDPDGDYEAPWGRRRYDVAQLEKWRRFTRTAAKLNIAFEPPDSGRPYRMRQAVEYVLRNGERLVVVANIFDSTEYHGIREPVHDTYAKFLLELRERTKNKPHEVVFLLFQPSDAWECETAAKLDPAVVNRFQGYFTLHDDIPDEDFEKAFAHIWRYQIQRDLLAAWRKSA